MSAPQYNDPLLQGKSGQGIPSIGGIDTEALIRHGFVRKVYGILSVQLLVTFAEVAAFALVTPLRAAMCRPPFTMNPTAANTKIFMDSHPDCNGGLNATAMVLIYGSMAVSFVLLLCLVCCIKNARTYPTNMILLSSFTLAEGLMLGAFCAFFDAPSVMLATAMTAVVVGALTAFACFTSIDFTGMGMYLYIGLIVLMMMGFFAMLFPAGRTVQLLYSGAGCLLFSFYLVYDTQLILGGKHKKYQFGVDDYVFAALNLYLDIINLFIYILSILSDR